MDSTPIKRMSEHSKARGPPCTAVYVCVCVCVEQKAEGTEELVVRAPAVCVTMKLAGCCAAA